MKKKACLWLSLFLALSVRAQNVVDSIVYDEGLKWQIYSSDGPVACFAIAGNGIWFAADGKVHVLNTRSNELKNYLKVGDFDAAGVTCMATDRSSQIWIGTSGGVATWDGKSFTSHTTANGLPDNKVTALRAASNGSVWAGTGNGAGEYKGGAWKNHAPGQGVPGNAVKAIAEDGKGGIWVGTNKGIGVYSNGAWTTHSMKTGLSANDVKALAYDKRDKKIWAAVGEMDINCYDGKSWRVFMDMQEGITSIMADTHSRIWFGSPDGLMKFNGDEWITDQKKLGIPAAMVTQMLCDNAGNMWFASGNGVIFLNNPYPY